MHLIGRLQFLYHALGRFYLLDNQRQTLLCLFIQISQISPELTTENKVIKANRMMLFQIFPGHPAPLPDGALFLGCKGKNRNIIIAYEFIPKAIVFIINMFLHLSHCIALLILVLELESASLALQKYW